MSNLSLVQVVDSKDDLLPNEFSLDLGHLSVWLALQVTMKRAAINVFHDKENLFVGFKSLVEFGQALVIQLLAGHPVQGREGLVVAPGLLVGTRTGQRVEDVGDGEERDPYGLYLDVPGRAARRLHIDQPDIGEANAIADELTHFHAACAGAAPCRVPLEDGLAALRVAQEVLDCIETSLKP